MQLINTIYLQQSEYTPFFIEGAVLAANMSPKALSPTLWIAPLVELDKQQAEPHLIQHFEQQYSYLMACEYDALGLLLGEKVSTQNMSEFAEGFMTVWPTIESGWNEVDLIPDGTVRMLQALLTTFMLAVNEKTTQQQMLEAGIDQPPTLDSLLPQLNLMINEVAKAADDTQQGSKAHSINPYKGIGRNDLCICGSQKKFKHCCGAT